MTAREKVEATDRLRRALLAFQNAQGLLLTAHRRLKDQAQAEADAFWSGPGRRIEANLRATATAVDSAFQQFSAAGLVASAADRHLVTQARRYLAEGS